MDPRNILDYLTNILRDTNPAIIHLLAKAETTVAEDTAFLALPDTIDEEDMADIMTSLSELPEDVLGNIKLKPLYKFNEQFTDKNVKAVISEAINDIANKCNGEFKLLPTKVAYFVVLLGDSTSEDREAYKENLQLFGSDSKFHRVILLWDEGYEIMEFNGGKAVQHKIKPDTTKLTKISELDDPARQRTTTILQDDILDLKILLGRSMDVLEVIEGLDSIGDKHGN